MRVGPAFVVKKVKTITHADLTAAVNGTAQTIALIKPPTGSRLVTCELTAITQFTGGSASAVTLDIGTSDDVDAIVDAADVLGGGTLSKHGTLGINPEGNFGGKTVNAIFTPDASHTLAGLTAGAVTITLTFLVVP